MHNELIYKVTFRKDVAQRLGHAGCKALLGLSRHSC
jgi:hypothetical protein